MPAAHNDSKRALRTYYHQILAPASDVDLFIYGLNEEEAVEKIKTVERAVRDSILSETTTIRTKNAITIVSEYPTRHIQIVLRLYKNISEILTGFDVDCSCVAYDGKQVWATPRSMAAYMTQLNSIDLTRRSPSYENRLSKYSHRGFEVLWPVLDRSRIDPTIYERSFSRVLGLARLLVLEKLPHPSDRDNYLVKRREERGRPALNWNSRYRHALPGNMKDTQPDDVAEWVEEDEVSNYHTFTVPYGPTYNAKKIEKLLFTKDLLLNAEWNKPKDRDTKLHRHPAFFGSVEDVIHDCCGFCPRPDTDEGLAAHEEEKKIYISGDVEFLKDDPGRQTIGSFHPLTEDDWTEQAYIGNTTVLCQAIVDEDLEAVIDWFSNGELETVDVNRRDHAGRTPLLLASMCSTPEIVQYLVDHDARIVSRLYNGFTALHFAAFRGDTTMVNTLCERSETNEAAESRKEETRRDNRRAAAKLGGELKACASDEDCSDDPEDGDDDDDESFDEMTEGSFVKVADRSAESEDDKDEPDVFDIDVLAWDSPLSPLHLAIIAGMHEVVKLLIEKYGADVLLPAKIVSSYTRAPESAILTLTLALQQPLTEARQMIVTLLSEGAISTQADMNGISALHYSVSDAKLKTLQALTEGTNPAALKKAVNHVAIVKRGYWASEVHVPLVTAIQRRQPDVIQYLLNVGAQPQVDFETFSTSWAATGRNQTSEETQKAFKINIEQPLVVAVETEQPQIALQLIEAGADVNICPRAAHQFLDGSTYNNGDKSILDLVDSRIKELDSWFREKSKASEKPGTPPQLAADETYTDYPHDTYRHWTAVRDLERVKDARRFQASERAKEVKTLEEQALRIKKLQKTPVIDLLSNMQALRETLVKKGAKSFRELYPKAPEATFHNHHSSYRRHIEKDNEPYKTKFDFKDIVLTHNKREQYLELFESAWRGDIGTVKTMTLSKDNPLAIAVGDSAGFSPFSIALLRGHTHLARVVLEIATVQYKPKHDEPTYRYRLGHEEDESDYDSDASGDQSDDGPRVFADIVDAKFTVDDIAALTNTVESRVSPHEMLRWEPECWRFFGELSTMTTDRHYGFKPAHYYAYGVEDKWSWAWLKAAAGQAKHGWSLCRHAILKNDINMLKFLIQVGTEMMGRGQDDDLASKTDNIASNDFELAVRLGRIEMVGEIIATTGAAIPLQTLVKTSGISLDEKPRHYQGLTVHGQKRQDWAARGAGRVRGLHTNAEANHSPILQSILTGNLQSAEYFLSDAPLRRYLDFAKHFETDKRIQGLAQAKGGIEGALSTWLNTRSDLALHVAIMSEPLKDGSNPMFGYILKIRPELIEVKDYSGSTPLLNAFKLRRIGAARALIQAGANQVARNDKGENVLHILSRVLPHDKTESGLLDGAISLLDSKLVSGMLMEKASSQEPSVTPLALLLQHNRRNDAFESCKTIFRFSGGRDLEVLNGAGDYVLHYLVRDGRENLVKDLVDYRPEMLHWENATGMTPLDVAETKYLRDLIDHPPRVQDIRHTRFASGPIEALDSQSDENETRIHPAALTELDALIADDDKQNLDGRGASWRMYHLLRTLATKYKGKRKLVSVLDANEVAKRLATQQQQRNKEDTIQEHMGFHRGRFYRNRYGGSTTQGEGNNEVSWWFDSAQDAPKWDWDRWAADVTGKE